MDPEATTVLFSKIRSIDAEHASKIMGYFLIQDLAERDLIRLAFGPETILRTMIIKAKSQLGLPSDTFSTPISPSPLNPISRPNSHNRVASTNGFPSSPSSNSWLLGSPNNGNSGNTFSPKSSPFISYDSIRAAMQHRNGVCEGRDGENSGDFIDKLHLNEYLSFINESCSYINDEFVDRRVQVGDYAMDNGDTHLHKRSFSASDACIGAEEAEFGVGYKHCMYFARGFCKNGENCKFMHSGFDDMLDGNGGSVVCSPSKPENLYLQQQHEEMMKLKAAQQHRLAAQFSTGGMSPLVFNKSLNFLLQQQNESPRLGAASLVMDEEFHKFGRCHPERNDFLATGLAEKANSDSRQVYLTFPADSTFRDEDVSNYFCNFGPVLDVRIPYQQTRMFGFVTFVHPDTVKLILARGNPHFICDSRVLVKPYKEKGKVPDKRRHLQQQLERGSISPCLNLSGVDSAGLYDLRLRARMYSSQEMMRRKLEEQAELHQAIELQGRRLMNLQLPDLIRNHQRSLSVGAPVSLPTHREVNKTVNFPSDVINYGVPEAAGTVEKGVDIGSDCNNGGGDGREENFNHEGFDQHERHDHSMEHVLPYTFFSSPTKSAPNQRADFATALMHANESAKHSVTSSSTENSLSMATIATVDVASH